MEKIKSWTKYVFVKLFFLASIVMLAGGIKLLLEENEASFVAMLLAAAGIAASCILQHVWEEDFPDLDGIVDSSVGVVIILIGCFAATSCSLSDEDIEQDVTPCESVVTADYKVEPVVSNVLQRKGIIENGDTVRFTDSVIDTDSYGEYEDGGYWYEFGEASPYSGVIYSISKDVFDLLEDTRKSGVIYAFSMIKIDNVLCLNEIERINLIASYRDVEFLNGYLIYKGNRGFKVTGCYSRNVEQAVKYAKASGEVVILRLYPNGNTWDAPRI